MLKLTASEFGMPEFRKKIGVIESLLHYWENNTNVELVAVQESDANVEIVTQESDITEVSLFHIQLISLFPPFLHIHAHTHCAGCK